VRLWKSIPSGIRILIVIMALIPVLAALGLFFMLFPLSMPTAIVIAAFIVVCCK